VFNLHGHDLRMAHKFLLGPAGALLPLLVQAGFRRASFDTVGFTIFCFENMVLIGASQIDV